MKPKCRHLNNKLVLTAGWYRKNDALISSDEALVFECEKCHAIRVDNKNKMCYGKGVWSHYTIRPI